MTPKIQISHEGKSTKTRLDVFDKDRSIDTVIIIIVSVLKPLSYATAQSKLNGKQEKDLNSSIKLYCVKINNNTNIWKRKLALFISLSNRIWYKLILSFYQVIKYEDCEIIEPTRKCPFYVKIGINIENNSTNNWRKIRIIFHFLWPYRNKFVVELPGAEINLKVKNLNIFFLSVGRPTIKKIIDYVFIFIFIVTNFCASFISFQVKIWQKYKQVYQAKELWPWYLLKFDVTAAQPIQLKLVRILEEYLFRPINCLNKYYTM